MIGYASIKSNVCTHLAMSNTTEHTMCVYARVCVCVFVCAWRVCMSAVCANSMGIGVCANQTHRAITIVQIGELKNTHSLEPDADVRDPVL